MQLLWEGGEVGQMTADERIEKLLNCFGQTLADLPKPEQGIYLYAYKREDQGKAHTAANEWCTGLAYTGTNTLDYICHLTDVIDRMEVALETAKLTMDCKFCKTPFKDCQSDCETYAKATDWLLSGMYKSEFKEFVEDTDDH